MRTHEFKHYTGPATETTKDGKVPLLVRVKRDTPLPAEPRKERIVMCDGNEVKILVSDGQFVNEQRVCKNYYKNA